MDHDQHHEHLIQSVTEEYQDVLENSEQGIYLYLNDANKVCNKNFATLLGYGSEEEWAKINESFPDAFVDDSSQGILISSYQDAIEKRIGSTIEITWKKKDGGTIKSTVILVPIVHKGHLFALHFVSS